MIVRGHVISNHEEEYAFDFLTNEFGREPTDDEMYEYIEWQVEQSEDRSYDIMEAELKGN